MNFEYKTEYCMKQEENNAEVSQEDLINWVAELFYADRLSSEIINKSFKALGSLETQMISMLKCSFGTTDCLEMIKK